MNTRFQAFISYSHADARWSAWLQRKLETYRVPRRVRGQPGKYGPVPERIGAVFRDREDLSAAGDLGDTIRSALAGSAALLVVCSPAAARSPWVDKEILSFKQLNGEDRIYALIVDGEPNAGDERECFPPALRFHLDADGQLSERRAEPLAADLRRGKDGRSLALLKMLSGLLGVDLDLLRQREQQRQHRRLLAIAAASVCGMMLTGYLAITASLARNDAQRRQAQAEDILGFMLGDLRQKLETVGRLDLLDSVGDKAMHYFADLDPRDLSDTALAQQAQALTQLGQVRLDQGRYPEALESFLDAYRRSEALAARRPGDGARLFDRGQAEFWVAFVHWQARNFDDARLWMERYLDSSRAVAALPEPRPEWLIEQTYAEQNLAVLELDAGRLDSARAGFARARDAIEQQVRDAPGDLQLAWALANIESWQGSAAERQGRLDLAIGFFRDQAHEMDRIREAEPELPKWQQMSAVAELLLAASLNTTGRFAEAEEVADTAKRRMLALTERDPENADWRLTLMQARVARASALFAQGRQAEATAELDAARPVVLEAMAAGDADRRALREAFAGLSLETALALHRNDLKSAAQAAEKMIALFSIDRSDDPVEIGRRAIALALAAEVAQRGGVSAQADEHLRAAEALLAPLVETTRYWAVLDPWLRVKLLAGDENAADAVRRRIAEIGYHPIFPWPTPGDVFVSTQVAEGVVLDSPR